MADGLVDTDVFLHAQTFDVHAEECLQFLEALRAGYLKARLEPMVLHELSYALPHYRKGMTRRDVAEYLLAVLEWDGVTGNKDTLISTVERWRDTPGLAFVDAYLGALAADLGCPVYSKNARELVGQGAVVPDPLPAGGPS